MHTTYRRMNMHSTASKETTQVWLLLQNNNIKETTAKTTKKINNRKKQIYFSHIIRTISGLMCEYAHISSHHDIEQDQQHRAHRHIPDKRRRFC